MRYFIQHVTSFTYSAPVYESVTEVRTAPRTEGGQRCFQFRLSCRPNVQVLRYDDHFVNVVYHFDVPTPHAKLEIVSSAAVEIEPQAPLPDRLGGDAWAELDTLSGDPEYWDWLQPSRFAAPSAALATLARRLNVGARRDDPLTVLRAVNHAITSNFKYSPESTEVDSPIDAAIKLRSGVCQDFAHIAIALLRRLGVPARYVSGYLFHNGSDRNTAPNSSHAWAEAYLPSLGWIGIDPTNDTIAAEKHVRVAIGRDYADVPPTRGVYKGDAESELAVAVNVSLTRREPVDNLALHVVRRQSRANGKTPAADVLQQQEQQQQ